MVVTYVIALIQAIPSTITYSDGAAIIKARTIYDSLSDSNKADVSNYSALVAAEAAYDELGVETLSSYQSSDFTSWKITGATTSVSAGLAGELSTDNTITAVSDFMLNGLTTISAAVNVTDKGTTTFTFYTSSDGENWTIG